MIITFDTEATGKDTFHGCRPFLLGMLTDYRPETSWNPPGPDDIEYEYLEWPVNPFTREVQVDKSQLNRVRLKFQRARRLRAHNLKFDVDQLEQAGLHWSPSWWCKVQDSLVASHVANSLEEHGAKYLGLKYLECDDDDQDELRIATNRARRIAQNKGWRIAGANDPHWPAVKRQPKNEGWWVCDMWIPRQIAIEDNYPKGHPWYDVCRRYNYWDLMRTHIYWKSVYQYLEQEGLLDQYHRRAKLIRSTYRMEKLGVHLHLTELERSIDQYNQDSNKHREQAISTLRQAKLLPPGDRSKLLTSGKILGSILYEGFGLPVIKVTKGKKPATDAITLEKLPEHIDHLAHLSPRRKAQARTFISSLIESRRNAKASDYLTSYKLWHTQGILHSRINITGTKETRQSTSDPNLQNVGNGKELINEDGELERRFNLRPVFGPASGFVWLDYDYSNVELRIWAHSCGNQELIDCFAKGLSVHMLIFRELWPELSHLSDAEAKETDQYKWTKNGDFALIYGAQKPRADSTYKKRGAYERIRVRFPEIDAFSRRLQNEAEKGGYVTTLGGYRLYVPRDEPHKAVNYFVQGSAGYLIMLAMNDCFEYCRKHPYLEMILQVHDELVFQCPASEYKRHHPEIVRRMSRHGEEVYGFQTPVGSKLIKHNWSEGIAL